MAGKLAGWLSVGCFSLSFFFNYCVAVVFSDIVVVVSGGDIGCDVCFHLLGNGGAGASSQCSQFL